MLDVPRIRVSRAQGFRRFRVLKSRAEGFRGFRVRRLLRRRCKLFPCCRVLRFIPADLLDIRYKRIGYRLQQRLLFLIPRIHDMPAFCEHHKPGIPLHPPGDRCHLTHELTDEHPRLLGTVRAKHVLHHRQHRFAKLQETPLCLLRRIV